MEEALKNTFYNMAKGDAAILVRKQDRMKYSIAPLFQCTETIPEAISIKANTLFFYLPASPALQNRLLLSSRLRF